MSAPLFASDAPTDEILSDSVVDTRVPASDPARVASGFKVLLIAPEMPSADGMICTYACPNVSAICSAFRYLFPSSEEVLATVIALIGWFRLFPIDNEVG